MSHWHDGLEELSSEAVLAGLLAAERGDFAASLRAAATLGSVLAAMAAPPVELEATVLGWN